MNHPCPCGRSVHLRAVQNPDALFGDDIAEPAKKIQVIDQRPAAGSADRFRHWSFHQRASANTDTSQAMEPLSAIACAGRKYFVR